MLAPLLVLAAPAYRIVDLGLPPGAAIIRVAAINNRSEVLVWTPVRETGKSAQGELTFRNGHGYLWRGGSFLDFGEPKPSQGFDPPMTEPTALNDLSAVVGFEGDGRAVFMSGLLDVNPFVWRGGEMEDLGTGWASLPRAINNLGDVVGGGNRRAFALLKGKVVALPGVSHVEPRDPGGEMGDINDSEAVAINDRRQILENATYGRPHKDGSLSVRPFLVDGNAPHRKPRSLPLPKGFDTGRGMSMNDEGTVLAAASRYDKAGVVPYLVRRGKVVLLSYASGRSLEGRLNARNDVIGTMDWGDRWPMHQAPMLWLGGRPAAFPRFAGWTLQSATGINDAGAICGSGLHNGKPRAYLLVPLRGGGEKK